MVFAIDHKAGWRLRDSAFVGMSPVQGPVRILVKPGGACKDAGSNSPLRFQLQATTEHRRADISTTFSANLLETYQRDLGLGEADNLSGSALLVPEEHLQQGTEYGPVRLRGASNMSAAVMVSRLMVGQSACHHLAAFLVGQVSLAAARLRGAPGTPSSVAFAFSRQPWPRPRTSKTKRVWKALGRSISRAQPRFGGCTPPRYSVRRRRTIDSSAQASLGTLAATSTELLAAARYTRTMNDIITESGTKSIAGATLEIRGAARYAHLSATVFVSQGSLFDTFPELAGGSMPPRDFMHCAERGAVLDTVDESFTMVPSADKLRALQCSSAAARDPRGFLEQPSK